MKPKEDPNTALFSIDVIQVPLASPENAKIVSRPRIFADPSPATSPGLWRGGNHGPGTQTSRLTNQCHDITVFPEVGLAAGACSGNGILLDISDPANPVRLDTVVDKSFAYWHSATFNNDGTKVIFTDEWGGGTRPRCRATDPPTWGADAIFDVVDRKLQVRQLLQDAGAADRAGELRRPQRLAHSGARAATSWCRGGIRAASRCSTSPTRPTPSRSPSSIAVRSTRAADYGRLLVGLLVQRQHLRHRDRARHRRLQADCRASISAQNEIDAAGEVRTTEFNAQQQPRVVWPSTPVVARAYVDQLIRSNALTPERAKAVAAALDASAKGAGKSNGASAGVPLETLASELEADAGTASPRDAARMRALATTLKGQPTSGSR